jgi:hypothetical protein
VSTTWVLVPCPRARVSELRDCLTSLGQPRERVVVVTTLPDPILPPDITDLAATLLLDETPGVNMSRWWNLGLDHIACTVDAEPYEVLITSSDCYGSPGGVADLARVLREQDVTMAGPDWNGRLAPGQVERQDGTVKRTVYNRLPGACTMLAGESGLRANEQYRWFFCDDHLETIARHTRGVALVGGINLHHHGDKPLDEQKAGWAKEDRAKYVMTWGHEPW